MSVRRALAEIDSAEFAEWMAYSRIEPFGPEREDYRFGVLAALIANVNRDSKTRPEPFTVDEFFPRYEDLLTQLDPAAAGPEPDVLQSKLIAWAAAMSQANAKERSGDSDKAPEGRSDGRSERVSGRGRGGAQEAPGPAATQDAL